MKCPNCGSQKIQKKGMRSGKQRYKCTECGANFCWGVKYKSAPLLEKLNKMCIYCGSEQIVRDGKLPSGKQRYKCYSCGKGFSDSTVLKEPEPAKYCPYCNSKLRKAGYSKLGYKEYYCKACGRSCTENAEGIPQKRETFKEINTSIECPSCSSKNIRLAGKRDGRRKYSCKDCGRTFIENAQVSRHSKAEIKNILLHIFKGKKLEDVAKKFNTTLKNISNIAQKHYEDEMITPEKRKMIINYGYFLKVPIDYLAEYVPCSRKACETILKELEKKNALQRN